MLHSFATLSQACSILYKTKLPLILVFNKCDVQSHEFAVEWMKARAALLELLGGFCPRGRKCSAFMPRTMLCQGLGASRRQRACASHFAAILGGVFKL